MSDVYQAVDEHTGEQVAVKLVRSDDPALARRMAREARALAALDHPNLVRLLDSGVVGGEAYLVMRLVDGTTLAARLRRGPLLPAEAAEVGAALAAGLAYIHQRALSTATSSPRTSSSPRTGKCGSETSVSSNWPTPPP
jgi:serine/threonine protein kinase